MLFLIEHFEGSSVRYYYQAQLARPARVQQLLHAFRNERSLLLHIDRTKCYGSIFSMNHGQAANKLPFQPGQACIRE